MTPSPICRINKSYALATVSVAVTPVETLYSKKVTQLTGDIAHNIKHLVILKILYMLPVVEAMAKMRQDQLSQERHN